MPPLLMLAFGSALGAGVYPAVQPSVEAAALGAVLLLGLAALASRSGDAPDGGAPNAGARGSLSRSGRLALAAAGLLLGMAGPASLPTPPALDGDWRIRGRVATAAWGREADVTLSAVARTGEPWASEEGRVRVIFPAAPPPPGTPVLVRGRARPIPLRKLPGAEDPAWEAARAGVVAELRADEVVRIGPPRPTPSLEFAGNAGLLRAMLDGDRSGVSEELAARMRRTGTWHLVSISGLHIGLAATAAWAVAWVLTRPLALLWRRGGLRWLCAAAAIVAACTYADLAGWPLPARRAVWMSAAGAIVAALRARPGAWEVLSLAWLGTTAAEPAAVANAGCQLSFSALAGMILVVTRVTRWLPLDTHWLLRWPVNGLATTLGATLGTLPTVAFFFQDLAPTAPLANLVAVPLLGTVATPALLASQLLPGALGTFALAIADGAVSLGLACLGPLDVAPWHPAVGLGGACALGVAVVLRRHVVVAITVTTLALTLVERPVGTLVVTFLDVGQGDATLVEWPDGRAWLIDGGPPGKGVLAALRRRGITRLDTVFVSHSHPDHYGGLIPVFQEMPVGTVRAPRPPVPGEDAYATLLASTRAAQVFGGAGTSGGPSLTLLHPLLGFDPRGNVNDESLVVRLAFGARRFLFPGDIEANAEAALVASLPPVETAQSPLRADVLKVPHHGSRTSSSAALLAAVAPSIAVIGVGAGNPYGHPNPGVLARYRGVQVWRTDLDGNVELRTDGRALEVRRERAEGWVLRAAVAD